MRNFRGLVSQQILKEVQGYYLYLVYVLFDLEGSLHVLT